MQNFTSFTSHSEAKESKFIEDSEILKKLFKKNDQVSVENGYPSTFSEKSSELKVNINGIKFLASIEASQVSSTRNMGDIFETYEIYFFRRNSDDFSELLNILKKVVTLSKKKSSVNYRTSISSPEASEVQGLSKSVGKGYYITITLSLKNIEDIDVINSEIIMNLPEFKNLVGKCISDTSRLRKLEFIIEYPDSFFVDKSILKDAYERTNNSRIVILGNNRSWRMGNQDDSGKFDSESLEAWKKVLNHINDNIENGKFTPTMSILSNINLKEFEIVSELDPFNDVKKLKEILNFKEEYRSSSWNKVIKNILDDEDLCSVLLIPFAINMIKNMKGQIEGTYEMDFQSYGEAFNIFMENSIDYQKRVSVDLNFDFKKKEIIVDYGSFNFEEADIKMLNSDMHGFFSAKNLGLI